MEKDDRVGLEDPDRRSGGGAASGYRWWAALDLCLCTGSGVRVPSAEDGDDNGGDDADDCSSFTQKIN